jgi:hypothetical protein
MSSLELQMMARTSEHRSGQFHRETIAASRHLGVGAVQDGCIRWAAEKRPSRHVRQHLERGYGAHPWNFVVQHASLASHRSQNSYFGPIAGFKQPCEPGSHTAPSEGMEKLGTWQCIDVAVDVIVRDEFV